MDCNESERPAMPLEKTRARRSPVQRILIVTGNAGRARDILPIFEIRSKSMDKRLN